MTPEILAELEALQLELANDINLCTTRDQNIRANQRYLALSRVLEQLSTS